MTTKGVGDAWVGNELRVLERHAIPFVLHALIQPDQTYFSSGDIETMKRNTRVIYPLPRMAALGNVLAAPFWFRARFFAALWNALTGERESLRNRFLGMWHLFVACHWAAGLQGNHVHHIHSQWIHSGGTVAMYGGWLLDVPFSFTGHAADLFRNRCALHDKIRRAKFIICISKFHRQFFLDNGARPDQLHVAYCGIDTSHFSPNRRVRQMGAPLSILSSGRLVDKKGFDVLIRACAILKSRGFSFECTIAGSGPLEASLRALITAAGLDSEITLTGQPLNQEDIPGFMRQGDVYCLPCVWAADNDVDGLPLMLMEAMACELPAVSTRLVGIPDLIRHEETGLLVEPNDPEALADALTRLNDDPALADQMAAAGRARVVDIFDLRSCLDPLINQYRSILGLSQ